MAAEPMTRSAVLASERAMPPSSAVGEVAAILRALGDPTRLAIAGMLSREHDALCVCHLEARFELSQPTVSHHLRVLREVALVTTEKRGTWVYYALDRKRVAKIAGLPALLGSVATASGRRTRACCP